MYDLGNIAASTTWLSAERLSGSDSVLHRVQISDVGGYFQDDDSVNFRISSSTPLGSPTQVYLGGQAVETTATRTHTRAAVADKGAEVVALLSRSMAAPLHPPSPSPNYIYA